MASDEQSHDASPIACIPNIGPRERRKRSLIGFGLLGAGVLIGAASVLADVSPMWRVLAFLPLWAGATSLMQVREKTCVALAARGKRNLDQGEEAITDAGELLAVRQQARRVRFQGFALAAVLMIPLVVLP